MTKLADKCCSIPSANPLKNEKGRLEVTETAARVDLSREAKRPMDVLSEAKE